jgi:hypothetical protein
MDRKMYCMVAGIIFTLVALFHVVRIYMKWAITIGGLISAEIGELGRLHRRRRPRYFRV